MTTPIKPRSMLLIGDQFLAIVWDDDHESFYDGPYLKKNCPCADCRIKRERAAASPGVSPSLGLAMAPPSLVGVEEVGRYAVRLRWSDGHSAGLFDLRSLRDLCPCDACRAPRP